LHEDGKSRYDLEVHPAFYIECVLFPVFRDHGLSEVEIHILTSQLGEVVQFDLEERSLVEGGGFQHGLLERFAFSKILLYHLLNWLRDIIIK
jgi:hypothetical protein